MIPYFLRRARYALGGLFLLSALALLAVRLWHPGWEFPLPKADIRTRQSDKVAYIQDLTLLAPRGEGFSLETELRRLALRSSSGGRFSLREDGRELQSDSGLLYDSAGPADPGRVHKQSRRLFFTASDGGDPRSGRYSYSLRVFPPIYGWLILQVALAGMLLSMPAGLYRLVWRFCASPSFIRFFRLVRYALGVLFILSALGLLAVRLGHPGWELELPKSDLIKVRADKVYFINDLRNLAPKKDRFSLEVALLRYALRSTVGYSVKENGRELKWDGSLTYWNHTLDEAGRGFKQGARLYFVSSDGSDPRVNPGRYSLRVFPPVHWRHIFLFALLGMALLAPAGCFISAWRTCLVSAGLVFREVRGLCLELWGWARALYGEMGKRDVWLCGVLVAVIAIVYVMLSPGELLAEIIGYSDTYGYMGYGYNYPDPEFSPGNYKISRLPWLYVMAFLWRTLRPELITPILATLIIAGQGIMAYALAWRLTRHLPAAVIAGSGVALFPFWHRIGGWNYHAHPSGMLFWLAIYLLPVNRRECTAKRYLSALAVFATALHVNPTLLSLVPAGLIWCLMPFFADGLTWQRIKDRKSAIIKMLIAASIYAVLAFVAVTALLCLSFKLTYGDWLFFLPNLEVMLGLVSNDMHFVPFSVKWLESGKMHITVTLLSFLASLAILFRNKGKISIGGCRKEFYGIPRLAALSYICAALTYFLAYLSGSCVPCYAHLAYGLQCFSLVPFSLFVAWACPEHGKSRGWACGIGFFVLFYTLSAFTLDLSFSPSNFLKYPLIPCGLLVMAAASLKLTISAARFSALSVFLALFVCLAGYSRLGQAVPLDETNWQKKDFIFPPYFESAPFFRILLRQNEKIQALFQGDSRFDSSDKARRPYRNFYQFAGFRIAAIGEDALQGNNIQAFCKSLMTMLGVQVLLDRFILDSTLLGGDSPLFDDLKVISDMRLILIGGDEKSRDKAEAMMDAAGLDHELLYENVEFDSDYSVHMWIYALDRTD